MRMLTTVSGTVGGQLRQVSLYLACSTVLLSQQN